MHWIQSNPFFFMRPSPPSTAIFACNSVFWCVHLSHFCLKWWHFYVSIIINYLCFIEMTCATQELYGLNMRLLFALKRKTINCWSTNSLLHIPFDKEHYIITSSFQTENMWKTSSEIQYGDWIFAGWVFIGLCTGPTERWMFKMSAPIVSSWNVCFVLFLCFSLHSFFFTIFGHFDDGIVRGPSKVKKRKSTRTRYPLT